MVESISKSIIVDSILEKAAEAAQIRNKLGGQMFRISLGTASCVGNSSQDELVQKVCKAVLERIDRLNLLGPQQLLGFKGEEREILKLGAKEVSITTYAEPCSHGGMKIVVQAFYSTWRAPNYFSLKSIGKLFAEGVVVHQDGSVSKAGDRELFSYR